MRSFTETGAGKASIKAVQSGGYPKSILTALDAYTWSDWQVMKLGWGK